MFTWILIVLAALVAVVLIAAACRPAQFELRRSTLIDASPAAIFPHVNASRGWEAWSPWLKLDPGMRMTYRGPAAGVGAVTEFVSRKAGEGSCTIVESRPAELIRFRLEMRKPFAGTSEVTFTFVPRGVRTEVAWSLRGPSPYFMRIVGLVLNCDAMMRREFDHGLAALKRVAEAERASAALSS